MVLSVCTVVAQNKIAGKVTDRNNAPLPGASITLPELFKGTIANEKGEFELTNLPNGKTKVQFSFVGYASDIKTVFLNSSSVELNASLNESVIEAEEIVVSGGYHSTQHENAVKIDVLKLNPKEVLASPNFSEVLTRVPGVDMISKGSGVSKPVIRGLSMNDILVLNNSVRYENYQYSSHHPLGIDEFGISLKDTGDKATDLRQLMRELGRQVVDVGGNFDKAGDSAQRALVKMEDGFTRVRVAAG